jgi:hypothetical protein
LPGKTIGVASVRLKVRCVMHTRVQGAARRPTGTRLCSSALSVCRNLHPTPPRVSLSEGPGAAAPAPRLCSLAEQGLALYISLGEPGAMNRGTKHRPLAKGPLRAPEGLLSALRRPGFGGAWGLSGTLFSMTREATGSERPCPLTPPAAKRNHTKLPR